MRSAVVAAAFVAGAIAVPFQKRDVVTDVDVAYVTKMVTVTAGEELPTAATSSSTSEKPTSIVQAAHFGHHSWHSESSSSEAAPVVTTVIVQPSTHEIPSSTSSSVHVAPTTSTFVWVAPSSSSTSSPVYVAPTTSTIVFVAPSSTSSTSESVAPVTTAPAVVVPTVVVPTSSAARYTSASSSAPLTEYSDIAVFHHNLHRANHSAPDLAWDEGLASTAATIAASCVYAHDTSTNGGGYGQNIAAGVESNNISAIITDLFYNGEVTWFPESSYGAANPDMTDFEHWGHFSQIVWKASTHVGCATQYCPGGLANVGSDVSPYFTVCNYQEVGNMGGEYGDNIGKPLGNPSADWNAGGIS